MSISVATCSSASVCHHTDMRELLEEHSAREPVIVVLHVAAH